MDRLHYKHSLMAKQAEQIHHLIKTLLLKSASPYQSFTWRQFASDGSDRQFFRCETDRQVRFIIILPAKLLPAAMAEANASFAIGRHLHELDIPVPKPYAFDEHNGALLFEDLGNILLYDMANGAANHEEIITIYRQAVECLATFQIKGRKNFNPNWCWDTRHYDRKLMLERESHYFSREFCQRYMHLSLDNELEKEFVDLAVRISLEPADYLLHRDYQSRNLMMVNGCPYIIDFQGARLGPLAYDLASLLNDPYMNLTEQVKDELAAHYISSISQYIRINSSKFMAGYYHIALQRNLQVLGAYAYLTLTKKKQKFAQYIIPATHNLVSLLTQKLSGSYPKLEALSQKILAKLIMYPPPEKLY